MKRSTYLLGIILFLTNYSIASAQVKNWTHFGLRPLAMGNAYVAVADDFNAVFYNPAGLARLNDWYFELFNPGLTVSKGAIDFFSDVSENTSKESDLVDTIEESAGEAFTAKAMINSYFVKKNFGFAIGLDAGTTASIHRDLSTSLNASADAIIPLAMAMNFLDGKLSVGASLKARATAGVNDNFGIDVIGDIDEGTDAFKNYLKSGLGFGVDFGVLFSPFKYMSPTLGLSITDLGSTHFNAISSLKEYSGTAPIVLPSVNLGLSLKPVQVSYFYLRTSVDMHSINQPYSFSQKLNLGLEAGLGQILKAQLGMHNGYYTAGLQFDIMVIKLRAVTYAEEIGDYAGQQEDRRYALQVKILI